LYAGKCPRCGSANHWRYDNGVTWCAAPNDSTPDKWCRYWKEGKFI
jgi:hypothetical protein